MDSQPLPSKHYQRLQSWRFEQADAATDIKRDFVDSLVHCLETLDSLQLESPSDFAASEFNELAVQSLLAEFARAVKMFFCEYVYLPSIAVEPVTGERATTLLGILSERCEAAHDVLYTVINTNLHLGSYERVRQQTATAGHMYDLSQGYLVLADVWRLVFDVPLHVYRSTAASATALGGAETNRLHGELPTLTRDDVIFTGVDSFLYIYAGVLNGELYEVGTHAQYFDSIEDGGTVDFENDEHICICGRLTTTELARLTLVTGGADMEEICSICLDAKLLGQVMVCLPCRHSYHKECGFNWLKRQSTCPICRDDVLHHSDISNRSLC